MTEEEHAAEKKRREEKKEAFRQRWLETITPLADTCGRNLVLVMAKGANFMGLNFLEVGDEIIDEGGISNIDWCKDFDEMQSVALGLLFEHSKNFKETDTYKRIVEEARSEG